MVKQVLEFSSTPNKVPLSTSFPPSSFSRFFLFMSSYCFSSSLLFLSSRANRTKGRVEKAVIGALRSGRGDDEVVVKYFENVQFMMMKYGKEDSLNQSKKFKRFLFLFLFCFVLRHCFIYYYYVFLFDLI